MLPRLAPMGWVAIVRPDRCVMAEGPVSEVEPLLQRALDTVEPAALLQESRARRHRPAVPRTA